MAGSTGGGIQVMRTLVLVKQGVTGLKRRIHPRMVAVSRPGSKPLDDAVLLNLLGFVLLFLAIFAGGVVALTFLGHDLASAVGASVATLADIGPGIGGVGVIEDYGRIDPWSHLLMVLLMIVGRLEIFTVLLLPHPGLRKR